MKQSSEKNFAPKSDKSTLFFGHLEFSSKNFSKVKVVYYSIKESSSHSSKFCFKKKSHTQIRRNSTFAKYIERFNLDLKKKMEMMRCQPLKEEIVDLSLS